MTRAGRAWRKANGYVRSGQHAKAIKWFSRTIEILDSEPPRARRFMGIDLSYVAGAVVVLVALWAAAGPTLSRGSRSGSGPICATTHDHRACKGPIGD
jgi:hypothetical protein